MFAYYTKVRGVVSSSSVFTRVFSAVPTESRSAADRALPSPLDVVLGVVRSRLLPFFGFRCRQVSFSWLAEGVNLSLNDLSGTRLRNPSGC